MNVSNMTFHRSPVPGTSLGARGICPRNRQEAAVRISTYVLGLALVLSTGALAVEEPRMVCDFSPASTVEWFNIDDVVMGGRSDSRLEQHADGTASFVGTVSLENNGGFASVRGQMGRADLSAYDGMALRVRGDGKVYGIRLRTDSGFDGLSYAAQFETSEGEWEEIRVPFDRFVPTFRGRIFRDVDPLDPSRIHQVGLIISDKQEGAFRLDLDWIAAY